MQGIQAKQDYRVIQLSEVDANLVFQTPLPTLLPFVLIMKGGGEPEVIREALTTLQRDPDLSELESLLGTNGSPKGSKGLGSGESLEVVRATDPWRSLVAGG